MKKTFDRRYSREQVPRTGWPPGLLQDDSRPLFEWFAGRPDARYILRQRGDMKWRRRLAD